MYLIKPYLSVSLFLWASCFSSSLLAKDYFDTYLLGANKTVQNTPKTSSPQSMNKWNTWVDSSEIRISDNDFSSSKDENYGLRVRLKNPKQVASERELLNLASQGGESKRNILRLKILRKSYVDILHLLELSNRLETLEQRFNITKLESDTFAELATTEFFDPSKVQRANLESDQLNLQIQMTQQSLDRALVNIGAPTIIQNQGIQQLLDYSQWAISVDEIVKAIDEDRVLENNPALQKLKLASDIAKKQVQRRQARKSAAVSLFKVEYDVDKDAYGATIGVRIPLGKNNFDSLMKSHKYQQAQFSWEAKLQSIKSDLLTSRHLIYDYYEKNNQEKALLVTLNERIKRLSDTNDPELILTLQKEQQRQHSAIQVTYLKVLNEYINFLFISGNLAETPLRNWLKKDKPIVKG